jgi:hypothetical protein
MTFWFAMVLYVSWQFIVYLCIYKAIKKQPEGELENAPPTPQPDVLEVPSRTSA